MMQVLYVSEKEREAQFSVCVMLFIGTESQWGDIMLVGGLLVLLVLCY